MSLFIVAVLFLIFQSKGLANEPIFADVRDFGAVGDGKTVNTLGIQQAIDHCAGRGGGTVIVAGGRYVTGTIYLKSFVVMSVEAGAALLGSTSISDYALDTGKNFYVGESHMDRCLIFARECRDIGIVGRGIIDGQGGIGNFPNKDDRLKQRPMMIRFVGCAGIRMRDIQLRNPAAWTTAWLYCNDVVVDGVSIESQANSNGDGLDFDGCQNVRVSNCAFNTSDDSLCLQTSNPQFPCNGIVVENCIMHSKWAAMRFGLLSVGNFENVLVTNCVFRDITDAGFKIQMCEGGTMRNMSFSNIVMQNVPRPLFLTLSRHRRNVDLPEGVPPVGRIENLRFSHLRVDNSQSGESRSGFFISGLAERCSEYVSFDDIVFTAAGGGTAEEGKLRLLPEFSDELTKGIQPEFFHLGEHWPFSCLCARHVKGLTLKDIRFSYARQDDRPAVVLDDAESVDLRAVTVPESEKAESLLRLQDVRRFSMDLSSGGYGARSFLEIGGQRTQGICWGVGNRCSSRSKWSANDDVPEGTVTGETSKLNEPKADENTPASAPSSHHR